MSIITLTTDFGQRDWFVGTMKGVILGINPQAVIVDVTHEVSAGDVRSGAFALAASYRYFPRGTVHLAIVDPGVGSRRGAIVVQTAEYLFVGPDNGVLSQALAGTRVTAVRRLEVRRYQLQTLSQTFHGRDVFAPVAAHLSRGKTVSVLGPLQKDFVRLSWSLPAYSRGRLRGQVVYSDQFGNAITNIKARDLAEFQNPEVVLLRNLVVPVRAFYGAVPAGRPVAVVGSSGFLEIAVNGGSAGRRFRLTAGSAVAVREARA